MVWGMSLPSNFGEFWPDGDFEFDAKARDGRWSERLRLYYLAQNPDEQRRLFDYGDNHVGYGTGNYGNFVVGKFTRERGTVRPGSPDYPPFRPVEPHEAPRSFATEKSYKTLGSLIELNDGVVAVDEALKTIIERLEPGIHQFFPIEICMPRGQIYPGQYYTMVIGRFIDSFLPESSKGYSWSGYGQEYPNIYSYKESNKGISGLALSAANFGNANLWRERSFTNILLCFSDALRAEIEKSGIRVPNSYRMMET